MFNPPTQNFPSNMQHTFSRVPQAHIERSRFVTPWSYKTEFDGGYLIPFFCDEVLPGDTFNDKFSLFARLATPQRPFIDNLFVDTFYFFVPNRLIWDNWEKFNGAQTNPGDSTSFLVPQCPAPASVGYAYRSLQDYMGIPPGITGFSHNSLHTRAYNLIWNTFFRDQNLQNSVTVDKGDGPDNPANYVLLRRGKRHDYFTSALPFPQKGPAVTLPLGTTAPVLGIGTTGTPVYSSSGTFRETGQSSPLTRTVAESSNDTLAIVQGPVAGYPGVYADLSAAAAASINTFRQAFQVQMLLEQDARGGTRYTEILQAHFGVTSPDFRLQRPEYLGGSTTPIQVTPVMQTSSTDATTPQGNLSAYGVAIDTKDGYHKSFVEHGVIIGMCSVRADLTYQQGLQRMWRRRTRYDYFWPAFAQLGEQTIDNAEIYLQPDSVVDGGGLIVNNKPFGYQERHGEYRYKPSLITGNLRSQSPNSLDIWHLAQEFNSLPTLGGTFIQDDPPIARVSAVENEPALILDVWGSLDRTRPMPLYGVPGLLTRL